MNPYHLIDVWNSESTMVLWLKDRAGKNFFLEDIYYPRIRIRIFSLHGREILKGLLKKSILQKDDDFETFGEDLWTGEIHDCFQCRVVNPQRMNLLLKETDFVRDHIEFYNSDITPAQGYFLEQNTYPFAIVSIQKNLDSLLPWGGNLIIKTLSSSLDMTVPLEERLPPLTSLHIFSDHGRYLPIGDQNPIRVFISNSNTKNPSQDFQPEANTNTARFNSPPISGTPDAILNQLNSILKQHDPDVIYSNGGDEYLFPQLFRWSKEYNIPLLLDREKISTFRNLKTTSRTFYSYGRIVFKTTAFPLFGRIHIDKRESFFFSESDWEGILEMAVFSRLPIQRLARSSPGTAMSAMEDEIALSKNILIPRIKGKASSIKPLSVMLKTDQGGMTFRPIVGYFENVLEFDFRSLYPSLMDIHNISGETVNCDCCSWDGVSVPVPETPYYTCTKRRGIVSQTVQSLISRRDMIKDYITTNPGMDESTRIKWEKKSTALKWCLVTCFGYTGYKNAKYGRREAHEAITAWGRYAITQAKEIAETMGYRFLHGLTDSLWLVSTNKKLMEDEAIQELYSRVKDRLNLRLLHEATYSWMVFPGSKNPKRQGFAVPTRYYAREIGGKMKYRGIALRRKNTPILVDDFQVRLLDLLSQCPTREEVTAREEEFHHIREEFKNRLRRKDWTVNEILIRQSITRRTGEFRANSASKIVLDAIYEQGITLEGGQSVEYIVCNRKSKLHSERYKPLFQFSKDRDRIDLNFYEGLLTDAWNELLEIFFPERDLFSPLTASQFM